MTVSGSASGSERLPDLATLSLRQQVAQLVVVRASGHLFDSQIRYPQWEPPTDALRAWIADEGVGGAILLGGSAAELAQRTRQLQSWTPIPLLLAADIEEGVGQRFPGATWFPPPLALAAIARRDRDRACALAEQMGAITAREALALGLNWLFSPVTDVNNNPDNPVINVRAFGETPEIVGDLVSAYLRGTQQVPVLSCAKHFPGHGDTSVDSHFDLPAVGVDADRLARVELPPFQRAIRAGTDSVMTAHLVVSAWDRERPATISPTVLGHLRDRLDFSGLIVTDALIMGAIARVAPASELPVLALEAGADIVLMPADPIAAINAICAAVESGRLHRERIRASLARIWTAKAKIASPPPLDYLAELTRPESGAIAHDIETAALRASDTEPVTLPSGTRNLVIVDDLLPRDFLDRHVPAIARPQQLGCTLHLTTPERLRELPADMPTLVQLFVRGNPFRGSASLDDNARHHLTRLLAGNVRAIALYGSPYLLDWLQSVAPPATPWVFAYGQMPSAQAIALDRLVKMSGFVDKVDATFL